MAKAAAGNASLRASLKAKAAGVYEGRPASIDATRMRALKAQLPRSHGAIARRWAGERQFIACWTRRRHSLPYPFPGGK
jgi:hypothetical protein